MTHPSTGYTAITFAPVQGFIEKSRKLRDLYGSSFIISYLANSICRAAEEAGYRVVSPAITHVTQGTPNQIILEGDVPATVAQTALNQAWARLTTACCQWIQIQVPEWHYCWRRDWSLWTRHAWEFFSATGATVSDARENLNEAKYRRAWTGINWTNESSTLSGTDAIAHPGMSRKFNPKRPAPADQDNDMKQFYTTLSQKIGQVLVQEQLAEHLSDASDGTANLTRLLRELAERYKLEVPETLEQISDLHFDNPDLKDFYACLSNSLGESIITPREQLSIPELVKRLVTLRAIAQPLGIEFPESFQSINRWQDYSANDTNQRRKPWTGWFCGDGDDAGKYFKSLKDRPDEADQTHAFSQTMRAWGETFQTTFRNGRIIYAGGDDFLGVFNRTQSELKAQECLDWFFNFPTHWQRGERKPISASVGFVWTAPGIPQRDVLQHSRAAEKAAKRSGRDRVALRILFNSGTHLEWVCPWRFLPVLQDYCDREGNQNWTHLFNDVAVLDARHAFEGNQAEVAIGLLRVYFKPENSPNNSHWDDNDQQQFYHLMNAPTLDFNQAGWWNRYDGDDPFDQRGTRTLTGILGDRQHYLREGTTELDEPKVIDALNDWIINLAKIGFHLCSNS